MLLKNKLVLAVIALFMAVSCITVDKTMGEELVPATQDLPIYIEEFDLPVQIKSSDSLRSISTSYGIFGAVSTPEYGLAEFATMAELCPSMTGWDFGKDAVVKEVYFTANISNHYVAQDNQTGIPQNITMHRTYVGIDSTVNFNNSITEADYNPEPLNVGENVYFGGDSIKMYLKNSFGEEILTATRNELDTLDNFVKKFKGVLIKSSTPDEGTTGGRVNLIDYGTGAIYIRVNFQPTWSEGLSRKDTLFYLSFGYNYYLNLSSYNSGDLQQVDPTSTLPIEGIGGVKPFIDHNALKDTIDNWKARMGYQNKDIVVAKAELTFPFEIPADLDMTKYPQFLYPCQRLKDTITYKTVTDWCYTPLEDIYVNGFSKGEINRSLCHYTMDIPSIMQKYVSKEKSELDKTYDMWIMPIYEQEETSSNSTNGYYDYYSYYYYGYYPSYSTSSTVYYYIDDFNYYVGSINGPQSERKPKLTLIYSVINE